MPLLTHVYGGNPSIIAGAGSTKQALIECPACGGMMRLPDCPDRRCRYCNGRGLIEVRTAEGSPV